MTARTAARTAPAGPWLKISAALTGQVPPIADRGDLVVTCASGAGHGSPACFFPALAAIEVDGTHLGVDPATANPASPADGSPPSPTSATSPRWTGPRCRRWTWSPPGSPARTSPPPGAAPESKEGTRSGLWNCIAQALGQLRPGYVLVENVAALRTRGLGRVLADLAALGYDTQWTCLRAADAGAPHRRNVQSVEMVRGYWMDLPVTEFQANCICGGPRMLKNAEEVCI